MKQDVEFLVVRLNGEVVNFNAIDDMYCDCQIHLDKEYKQDKKKYEYYNKMTTTCDICGKEIIGIENFIDAGDKVVCSENCKQTAIAEFRHWQETESHNWRRP